MLLFVCLFVQNLYLHFSVEKGFRGKKKEKMLSVLADIQYWCMPLHNHMWGEFLMEN